MTGYFVKDSVYRALRLVTYLMSRKRAVTVKQIAAHLDVTVPCARKWINYASLEIPIVEYEARPEGSRGYPTKFYKLLKE